MAVGDENIIEHDVVKISPDLTGFREKLKADLAKAVKGVFASVKVKLVADATGFNKSAKVELAKQAALKSRPTYKIRLVADATGFNGTAKNALRGLKEGGTVRIRTVADKASADRAQRDVEQGLKRIEGSSLRLADDINRKLAQKLNQRFLIPKTAESISGGLGRDLAGQTPTAAAKERQRKDEAYAAFRQRIADVLQNNNQHHAAEEVRIKHETIGQLSKLDRAAQRASIDSLSAVERAFTSAEARKRKESGRTGSSIAGDARKADSAFSRLFAGPKLVSFGGAGIQPWNLLIAAAVAASPILIAVGSNALSASTSLAALGTSAIGAGLAIGGLSIAFSGVNDLFKAYTAFENESITAGANAANSAKTQANGYNQLADSLLAVSNAKDSLAAAQQDELEAQTAIGKAREKARRDIDNLRQSILDLQNAERGDLVSVAEARQKAASTASNFFATGLDKARANQDVRDAITRLSDDRLELAQKRADLLKTNKQGIEGSDDVTSAKRAADAARRRVNSAQHTLNRSVKTLNTTQAGQSQTVSSAQAVLNEQMRRASPAARQMLAWYKANEVELRNLGKAIQQGVLPGFNRFLEAVFPTKRKKGQKTVLGTLAADAAELGGIIGGAVGKFGAWLDSPFFKKEFGKIQAENAADLQKLADAGLALLDPIARIVVAASPLAGKMADGIKNFAEWFAKLIKHFDTTNRNQLADWFEKASQRFGYWLDIGKNLLSILGSLFKTSLPTGDSLVVRLRDFTKSLADAAASPAGQAKLTAFFDFFKNLNYGQVANAAKAIGEMFAVVKVTKALFNASPFTLFLGALATWAASNPEQAARVLGDISKHIEDAVGFLAAHKGVLETFLAIVGVGSLGKAVGFSFKLPVLDTIKNFLVGKFSVLEKFVGGGANTATMNVRAGVVYITGAGAIGVGANEGAAGTPGTGGGKGKRGLSPGRTAAVGGGLLLGGALLDAAPDPASAGANQLKTAASWAMYAGGLTIAFGPEVAIPAALIAAAAGAIASAPGKTPPGSPQEAARQAFAALQGRTGDGKFQGHDIRAGTIGISNALRAKHPDLSVLDNSKPLQDFIGLQTKSNLNAAATSGLDPKGQLDIFRNQTKMSAQALSGLLQQWGLNKEAAEKYAAKVYDVNDATGKATDATYNFGQQAGDTRPTVKDLADQTRILWEQLEAVDGGWVAALSMPGYTQVAGQLMDLLTQQYIAANPNATQGQISEDRREKGHFLMTTGKAMAVGGAARGPGTGTSDSIPAWLSNGEHVWTAQEVVKAGGHDAMFRMRDAARRGALHLAKGGIATTMPFALDLSGAAVPTLGGFGGVVSGDQRVAAIAEATARALHASDKQLIALIEAGLVESGLHNLNYGDRDSLGFLQQRAGWGSAKSRMDVAASTRRFLAKAKGLDNAGLSAGQLAQAVQVSAYPDRYDNRYADAIAVLNAAAPYVLGGSGALGGMPGGRGWQWEEAVLRKAFGKNVNFFSTTGGKHVDGSWHYKGRAVDLTPSMAIFDWIKSHYGASTLELIYGPAGTGIKDGKPYNYGPKLNAEHMKHIHWAYANGGAVMPVRTYDTGGDLPPGYTLAFNGTGRTEEVRTADQRDRAQGDRAQIGGANRPVRLDRRDMAILAGHIVTALAGQGITMDGRRVAETVRGYDYLPRGL